MDFLTRLFGEHSFDLAAGRLRGGTILSVKVLCHEVAAQQQHGGFIGPKTQRGQKVALHQRVASTGDGDERHTGLT